MKISDFEHILWYGWSNFPFDIRGSVYPPWCNRGFGTILSAVVSWAGHWFCPKFSGRERNFLAMSRGCNPSFVFYYPQRGLEGLKMKFWLGVNTTYAIAVLLKKHIQKSSRNSKPWRPKNLIFFGRLCEYCTQPMFKQRLDKSSSGTTSAVFDNSKYTKPSYAEFTLLASNVSKRALFDHENGTLSTPLLIKYGSWTFLDCNTPDHFFKSGSCFKNL